MGKPLLILAATILFAACAGGSPDASAHAELSCAACHQGPQGERGRATVPEASCTGSGCHELGGPEQVDVATVRFPHRDHGQESEIRPSCAGCHTHETGTAPLEASVDACALCHIGAVAGGEAQECRLCHTRPDHSELTSQGVMVAHSEIPWLEIGCVRCHFDVSEGGTEVTGQPCRECHEDMAALNAGAVGRDLHPIHEGVTCTSCHRADVHEVRAMSTVVQLACSDCHALEHGVPVHGGQAGASELCVTCHTGIHSAQQRLVLGVRPDSGVTPSSKFLAGITCRSCHVAPEDAPPDRPVRGRAEACSGCHPPEYERVLDWWQGGLAARLAAVTEYLDRGRRLEAAPDSARALLEDAEEMVSLVREAGGQHNLELSDQLLRGAVARVQRAFGAAGEPSPPAPDLGRAPHMGLCTYCHYEATSTWDIRDMPEDFHRTVLGDP